MKSIPGTFPEVLKEDINTNKVESNSAVTTISTSASTQLAPSDSPSTGQANNSPFFPASITSWFYGTSINDAKDGSTTSSHLPSDAFETGSIAGSISSEPSSTSESKSTPSSNKRAQNKIAARLEALRKK